MSYNVIQCPYSYNKYNCHKKNNAVSDNVLVQQSFVSTSPNFRGQLTTPPDTVSFGAGNQIKSEQKQGISTLAKVGLGTLVVIGGGIATHKLILEPKIVQKKMQDIFLCDFTKDEAMALKKKYKDIYKIKDTEQFLDKMFEELKKDFKLENMPIKLYKNFKTGTKVGEMTLGASYSGHYSLGCTEVAVDKNIEKSLGRGKLVEQLTHEMRHARQDMARYQVGTDEELYKMYEQRYADSFKDDKTMMNEIQECAKYDCDSFISFFKKTGIQKITKSDRNYEWSKKQLESYSHYANKSKNVYDTIFYETDAKRIGELMRSMIS